MAKTKKVKKKADPFAEMDRRERALLARLKKAPVMNVVGLVDASGPGAARGQGQRLWTWSLTFDAWRIASGELRTEKLKLMRKASEREVMRLQDAIAPYAMLKVRARVVEAPQENDGNPAALLEKLVGPAEGERGLQAHLKALQRPVTRSDKVLGKLTLDRRMNWYSGNAKWNGKRVKVDLSAESDKDVNAALRVAHALWKAQATWSRRVSDFAVAKLLRLKNDHWLDEGEKPVSENDFRRRMKLESIGVSPDGNFDFWYDDGDLFWGHSIQVTCDLKRGPRDVDTPG